MVGSSRARRGKATRDEPAIRLPFVVEPAHFLGAVDHDPAVKVVHKLVAELGEQIQFHIRCHENGLNPVFADNVAQRLHVGLGFLIGSRYHDSVVHPMQPEGFRVGVGAE